MDIKDITRSIARSLDVHLFDIGGKPISLATILTVVTILIVTWTLSNITQRTIQRVLKMRGLSSDGTIGIVIRFVHYLFLIVGFGIALETVGIDLRTLFAAGAVFAVGLGLAMQNITQNFVSGVILMAERAIKPGDVLEVEGIIVRVKHLGMRSTVVESRFGEALIVPNSILVQSTVKNFTLRDSIYRLRGDVGVHYRSDMKLVQKTLEEAADRFEGGMLERRPLVVMTGFGNNSVTFTVMIWVTDPWREPELKSRLYHTMWDALQRANITIAFPQLDVHFDAPFLDALGSRGGTEALGRPRRNTLPT